ncbi:hypothetical protein HYX08_02465 [Candidatus Woesearchaeota archaeon]|nr:hypothetical protein [Candidatus Woesearchaeota archaeon]
MESRLLHDLDFIITTAELQQAFPKIDNTYAIASDSLNFAKEIYNWYSREDIARMPEKREIANAVRELMPEFIEALCSFYLGNRESIAQLKRLRDGIAVLPEMQKTKTLQDFVSQNARQNKNQLLQPQIRH